MKDIFESEKVVQGSPSEKEKERVNIERGSSDLEEIFADGPFSAFFNDFEILYGPFLIILHRLLRAIFQVNGTMVHGPLPSQSLGEWLKG